MADIFDNLVINGKRVGAYDWKAALVEILSYEFNRIFEAVAKRKIEVLHQYPATEMRMPLVTVEQLGDESAERFVGDEAGRTIETGEDEEGNPTETAHDDQEWPMREVYEIRVWSDNRELSHAMYRLARFTVMAWAPDMVTAGDIRDLTIFGGRDEEAVDHPGGRPIYWRMFNVSGIVPALLATDLSKIENVEASGTWES